PQQNYHANSAPKSPVRQTLPQQNYHANPTPQPPVQQTLPQQNYHANSAPKSPVRQTLPQQNYHANSAPQPPMRTAPQNSATGMYLRKGQKISISEPYIKIALGWEVLNPQCELDASAFILNQNQVVLNDNWFVFYGQPTSPDKTVQYSVNQNNQDKALIDVQVANLNPDVQKIVFAVTIYEAFERQLNFSMTRNVYGRILNNRNQEIARFDLTDCYSEVTAMVIGELYRYQGAWKFNAVGSGVAKDLPAFCGMYGVNFER
ncbi:MAG: TerD family protein, partial [Oscillospiraceae bacterium]|nr:TerD family protein [Oscillospiraceae bacterium]